MSIIEQDDSGLILSDSSAIHERTRNDFIEIFGEDFNIHEESVAGRLIELISSSRISLVNDIVSFVNTAISPDLAGGVALDIHASLLGIEREPAEKTKVVVSIDGSDGVFIPSGSTVKSSGGNIFSSSRGYTISGGSVDVEFFSEEFGAIYVDPGEIDRLGENIDGVASVSNASASVPGRDVESDRGLRSSILYKKGVSSIGSIYSIISNILHLNGVRSMRLLENFKNVTSLVDGINMTPHSIMVVVEGGDGEDIKRTIHTKKSLGCDIYSLGIPQVVENASFYDEVSDSVISDISYVVARPRDIHVQVDISQGTYSDDLIESVRKSVVDGLSGDHKVYRDPYRGWAVGEDVKYFVIVSKIQEGAPGAILRDVQIRYSNNNGVFFASVHGGMSSIQLVTSGEMKVNYNGAGDYAMTGLDFSSDQNMTDVASRLTSSIQLAPGMGAARVSYNESTDRLEIRTGVDGTGQTMVISAGDSNDIHSIMGFDSGVFEDGTGGLQRSDLDIRAWEVAKASSSTVLVNVI